MARSVPWHMGEVAILKEYWGKETVAQVARRLGRSRSKTAGQARRLKLPRLREYGKTEPRKAEIVRRTVEENQSPAEISAALKISKYAIIAALGRWEVKRDRAAMIKRRGEQIQAALVRHMKSVSRGGRGDYMRLINRAKAAALGWPRAGTPARATVCEAIHRAGGEANCRMIEAQLRDLRPEELPCRTRLSLQVTLASMADAGVVERVRRGFYKITAWNRRCHEAASLGWSEASFQKEAPDR